MSLALRIFASTPTVKCWKGSKRGCSQQYAWKLLQLIFCHDLVSSQRCSLGGFRKSHDVATTSNRFATFRGNLSYSSSRVDRS